MTEEDIPSGSQGESRKQNPDEQENTAQETNEASEQEQAPQEETQETKPEESTAPETTDDSGEETAPEGDGSEKAAPSSEESAGQSGEDTPETQEDEKPKSMEDIPEDEDGYKELPEEEEEEEMTSKIYALRTTANREDQVLEFVSSNAARKKIPVYAVIRPHGMRGYIFLEAKDAISAEEAASGVPYAKGVIPKEIDYQEIEHMLEQVKKEIKIQKNDIVEIIAGPFKREQAKITRVDKQKEEVVVELLEAAVPIPITLKLDDVKVIRREDA